MKSINKKSLRNSSAGFTMIELLVIVLIIGVLLTVLVLTYGGVQIRQRNSTRVTDIKLIQANLETYYAQSGFYPTLSELNNTSWTNSHLKNLQSTDLQDPKYKANTARFVSTPTVKVYSYQPTSSSGAPCDNKTIACGKYTLTATLEGNSGTFVEKSLN